MGGCGLNSVGSERCAVQRCREHDNEIAELLAAREKMLLDTVIEVLYLVSLLCIRTGSRYRTQTNMDGRSGEKTLGESKKA